MASFSFLAAAAYNMTEGWNMEQLGSKL